MNTVTDRINNISLNDNSNGAIKIQSILRGNIIRQNLQKLDDVYDYELIYDRLCDYNNAYNKILNNNNNLNIKKIRNENFPSDISENIAKFAICKKYKIMPNWDIKPGDLRIDKKNVPTLKLEIKGFMSTGPSSFGPTEKWDRLYFVDCRNHLSFIFVVYEINLKNDSDKFKNISISKTETYHEVCKKKKRARASFFNIIKPQLQDHCKIIFDGHISELE